MSPWLLKDRSTEELIAHVESLGGRPQIARKLQSFAMKNRLAVLPTEVSGIARPVWGRVRDAVALPNLELLEKVVSPYDGFAKYLFRGEGSEPFEAVRIPLLHRPGSEKFVVCVSSQVGCAARCAFCATGRLGFKRHLKTWEIVDQVVKIQEDSPHRVGGVVFMGMGEPFFNYERVVKAARLLSEPSGLAIDGKAITISTVGIVPMIKRFTREGHPYRLIVSLTSARAEVRNKLLPMNEIYPLESIKEALLEYQAVTGRRVTFAWTMISGVNTGLEEAQALRELCSGLRVLIDLIPVNDTTGRFDPPSDAEYQQFLDHLRAEVAAPIVRRYSGGKDVAGACGMLAGTFQSETLQAAEA